MKVLIRNAHVGNDRIVKVELGLSDSSVVNVAFPLGPGELSMECLRVLIIRQLTITGQIRKDVKVLFDLHGAMVDIGDVEGYEGM